jgi:hypothetical protein
MVLAVKRAPASPAPRLELSRQQIEHAGKLIQDGQRHEDVSNLFKVGRVILYWALAADAPPRKPSRRFSTMVTQKGSRKTTGLRQATESNRTERPARSSLLVLLESTTKFIGYVTVILLAGALVFRVVADMRNRPILIDSLSVPKTMEDEGYTGLVAANRLAAEIVRIEQTTKTIARKDKFNLASSERLPDIEIPETKLSIALAVGIVENFLGVAPPHVSVELILASGPDWHRPVPPAPDLERAFISFRMNGGEGYSRWTEVVVHSPDEVVTRTAREVLEMTDPYILALYTEYIDHDGETALRLMQEANERDPNNTLIYVGWGNVLNKERDYAGANAKYEQALALEPKFVYAYYKLGRRPRR